MAPPHCDRDTQKKAAIKGGFYAKYTEKTWQTALTAFILNPIVAEGSLDAKSLPA
jgi:hypothetical protein